jgi:hypothetical protein
MARPAARSTRQLSNEEAPLINRALRGRTSSSVTGRCSCWPRSRARPSGLDELRGRTIPLRFHLAGARLYSFAGAV